MNYSLNVKSSSIVHKLLSNCVKLLGKVQKFPQNFTQLGKILQDRRSHRSRQISSLLFLLQLVATNLTDLVSTQGELMDLQKT